MSALASQVARPDFKLARCLALLRELGRDAVALLGELGRNAAALLGVRLGEAAHPGPQFGDYSCGEDFQDNMFDIKTS